MQEGNSNLKTGRQATLPTMEGIRGLHDLHLVESEGIRVKRGSETRVKRGSETRVKRGYALRLG